MQTRKSFPKRQFLVYKAENFLWTHTTHEHAWLKGCSSIKKKLKNGTPYFTAIFEAYSFCWSQDRGRAQIKNSRDCKMVKGIWGLLICEWRLDVFRTFVQTSSGCWSVGLYNQEGSQLFANADICSQVNHSQSHHQIISLGFVFKTTNWYHSGEISSITNTLFGLHLGWMSEGRQHI